jgi:hypothetical protein
MEDSLATLGLQAGNLLRLVPEGIVLWACIALYNRTKGTPAALMLAGAGLGLVMFVANMVVTQTIYSQTATDYSRMSLIFGALTFVGLVGGVLFAVGLLMQVNRWVAEQDEPKDEY